MAQAQATHGRIKAQASPGLLTRNVRAIVVLSVLLIAGSFASATAIQMRLDRSRALEQAAWLESRRARELATDFAATLDRYAALGTAFATATGTAETSAALSEAGGPALANIAVLSNTGAPLYEMKGDPSAFLPLPPDAEALARWQRVVVPGRDGKTMVIAYPVGERIVAIELDMRSIVAPASMEESVIATRDGDLLAIGSGWKTMPGVAALAASAPETRELHETGENRLVSLSPVPGWPATAGASVATGEALGAWYGALPFYLFLILGPALAGAGLAFVFVREFERRTKASETVKKMSTTKPDEARLLIRLADSERRAGEAQRAKTEFIAHMSHELRTPLNAIIGFAEVIERGMFGAPGHPKYVEYAHDINTAGRALHDKIGDILDFADLEAGKQKLEIVMVDISAVVRAAIADAAGRAFLRRIKLTVALPDTAIALADAQAVKRIVVSLVTNALQYTPEDGAVRVQLKSEGDWIVLSLRDNGLGFSQAEMEKLGMAFTRFDRAGATTGTGMGIAIATSLASRMHGAVRFQSAQGEGTLAELRLPKA